MVVDGISYGEKPMGISFGVLLKVDNFIFPTDFVVFDYDVYFEMTIIFARLFLTTYRALEDMKKEQLKFRLNDEEVTFNVCRIMKQPTNKRVVLLISCVDDPRGKPFRYPNRFSVIKVPA